jgi:Glycosyl hydrolase family 71.
MVFAHYFPPYPISLDNVTPSSDYYTRNYLSPWGEGSAYLAVGGLLRARPLPRAPLSGNWRVADLTTEVDQAADAGINGFTVDVLSLSGMNWTTTTDLMAAATASGRAFHVVPNLDVTTSIGQTSPAQVAASLAQLYASAAAYRLPDGRYVLSTFKAEGESVAWWSQVTSILKNTYHKPIALISVFLNSSDTNMKAFAPISWAESIWGQRTPATIAMMPDYAAKAHALGVKWMAPVAVQDERPRSALYAEAGNTATLRASWQQAITDGADMAQLVTWNDYSENTSFAPSPAHGHAFLDISAYYEKWFRSGAAPALTRDEIIVTHRIQMYSAIPQVGTLLMKPTLNGTYMAPRNTVEVLAMLRAPATVRVTIGTHVYSVAVAAGVHALTFPLALGTVKASAIRNGTTIMALTSPHTVVSKPEVQDLQYYAAGAVHN